MKYNYTIPEQIWKNKYLKPEGKLIYSYIYAKGFDKIVINLNVGELQQVVSITNKGLRKNLERLKQLKYLIFKEYDTGMYTIHLTK